MSLFSVFIFFQLRREKIDLENTLEQEQEALVNRLWKRMDKLEAEKRFVLSNSSQVLEKFFFVRISFNGPVSHPCRILQEKLDQPVSAPPSPRDISMEIDSPENMMRHIRVLKSEVERLKKNLLTAELQRECWNPLMSTIPRPHFSKACFFLRYETVEVPCDVFQLFG